MGKRRQNTYRTPACKKLMIFQPGKILLPGNQEMFVNDTVYKVTASLSKFRVIFEVITMLFTFLLNGDEAGPPLQRSPYFFFIHFVHLCLLDHLYCFCITSSSDHQSMGANSYMKKQNPATLSLPPTQ